MPRRHPRTLPKLWLMTDERQGDRLLDAVRALPRGAGVVFRHYRLPPPARRALFRRVRRIARARGLMLLLAGSPATAAAWGADGAHGRGRGGGLRSAPVHDHAELRKARGADLVFVSPVYPTRSHPGAHVLGLPGLGRLCRLAPMPVIALGGLDARRGKRAMAAGAWGWAAIDGLTPA